MSGVLFVVTHRLGPEAIGIGDVLLHTPLFGWVRDVDGQPVVLGTFPQFEWIGRRCPAVGSFESVRSPVEVRSVAGRRCCLLSDYSGDEHGYYFDGLTYTQIIAGRLGIPPESQRLSRLLYRTTAWDRRAACRFLAVRGWTHRQLVTINAQGRSRAHQPGLKPAEYVELARGLAKATGAVVLIGDLAYRRLGRQVQIASVSLPVWAALIERSAMWLGECTGPYHLAAALETPTVLFTAAGVDSRPWLASNYNRVSNRVFKDVSGKQARLTEVRKVLCSTLEATDKEDRQ